jgi:pantoate--beta-alanine ligase
MSMPIESSHAVRVIESGAAMRAWVREEQQRGRRVGFVPTMGALHEGHLSLVDAAAAECDVVAASIFVNPTQFGAGEDFAKYPRVLDRDLEMLRGRGCAAALAPTAEEMYPPGFETSIDVGAVAEPWEGVARPGHFRGVATVVHKLFQLVPADAAYFGQKDYQQTLVVRRMVADLNVPIEIRVQPTVREGDGLALSSRNAFLSPEERVRAAALWRSLAHAESLYAAGETDVAALRRGMLDKLHAAGVETIDYIAFLRDGTVEERTRIDGPTVIALAARVGGTRLIDNHRIGG